MSAETHVHCVAACRKTPICGLVDGNGRLWCVDVHNRAVVATFPVTFDIGGHRVALDAFGKLCISAAYQRSGVAAYTIPGGEVVWKRPDLKKVQKVIWDDFHNHCIVIRDPAGAEVLNTADGRTIDRIPRVRGWYPSAFEPLVLCEKRELTVLECPSRSSRFSIDMESFSTLDACFSPDAVFISEASGPLRTFCLTRGKLRWRLAEVDQHYLAVCLSRSGSILYGIRWEFIRGTKTLLDSISPETGRIVRSLPLSTCSVIGAFACEAAFYVSSDFRVTDTATGETFVLPIS